MTVEVEALLRPLDGPDPCGDDLSFSADFDAIQEARREDDPSLDQGEWVTAIKEAQWGQVVERCAGLLALRTKDLRVAGWLIEGLCKTKGVGGLADGAEVFGGLVARFWGALHPRPEGSDEEERIGNIAWLVTRCRQLAGEFPLVSARGEAYGLTALVAARELQKQMDRDPDAATELAAGRLTMQAFRELQRATPRSFFEAQMLECGRARAALAALADVIDARLGLDGPSFTPLREALETYANELERLAREAGVPAGAGSAAGTPAVVPDAKAATGADGLQGGAVGAGGPIRTRQQALATLREVAAFFRDTEPHSPVAYLADKAARWGEMPLHVWLKAVLKEEGAMSRFEDLLGIEEAGHNGAEA